MKIVKTNKRCPRCGSRSFQVDAVCETTYIYQVEDGIVTPDGMDNDGMTPIRTICTCNRCNYHWHPKKYDDAIEVDYMEE
ncbi:MAG: hypothetical protein IJ640_00205 [Prevotella sp.]|nr:hypothetical protein [Prevotella sp.]